MVQVVITELVSWSFSSKTKKDENITLSCLIFVNIYHETFQKVKKHHQCQDKPLFYKSYFL